MSSAPVERQHDLGRLQWLALGVGVVCLLVCILGAPSNPVQFFRSYLSAYLFYLGLPLGSMVLLMIYHVTGGAWGLLLRGILENGMRTLPLMALLFTPIACGLPYLFPWARPEEVAQNKLMQHQQIYLNPPFFWVRAALYFIVWLIFAYLLSSWSRRQAATNDPAWIERFNLLSGPGLVAYGISMEFASVDWSMSLTPAYRSTIYGPVFAVGEILSAMALGLIVLAWLIDSPPLAEVASVEALNDLGSLLFTFLIIWSYMVFFQFMLTWIADLPYDVSWYVQRSSGGWQYLAWALFILHFAVPFFLLLQRVVKRNPKRLASVAGLMLFMQLVHMDFQILPAFPGTSMRDHWMDFLAPIGLGGIWLAFYLWLMQRSPLLLARDPNWAAAADYRRHDQEEVAREEEVRHG